MAPPLETNFVQTCWKFDFNSLVVNPPFWMLQNKSHDVLLINVHEMLHILSSSHFFFFFFCKSLLYLLDIWLNRTVQGSGFNVFGHQIERVQNVKSQTFMSSSNLARWRSSFLCKRLMANN